MQPQLFRAGVSKADLEAIGQAINTGWGLGNDRFRAKTDKLSGGSTVPKPRGKAARGGCETTLARISACGIMENGVYEAYTAMQGFDTRAASMARESKG